MTTETTKHPDILTALNAIMVDLPAVGKDGHNNAQNFNFRGIDGVLNACGPVLRKHGVVAAPRALRHIKDVVPRKNGGSMTHVLLELEVVWLLAGHPVDEGLRTVTWGEAFDMSDKATAKAHSVALRTAYIQTLALPTQEADPDESYIERGDGHMNNQYPQQPSPQQQAAARKKYVAEQTQGVLKAEEARDMARLRKALAYYSQQGDRELAQMVATTIDRLEKSQRMGKAQETVGNVLDGEVVEPTANAA
ncbi:ERF family protein [Corynebacterium striatum]|uniref:ERF family protein n=1 Tax=Corynebacterium striatum TaxID=43770 RepID=UPI003B5A6D2F